MASPAQTQRFVDSAAFLAAVVLGIFTILGLKPLGVPQLVVTAIVCLLVVAYSFVIVLTGQLRVRLDQAGDNAYYLGLVYTLISMIRALYEVGRAVGTAQAEGVSTAEMVIGDFGIALSSTLVGIVCRLVLQQMRQDPYEVERAARMELAEAASRMKAKLTDASTSIGEFHEGLRQRHTDYVEEIGKRYRDAAAAAAEQLSLASTETTNAMRTTSDTFSGVTEKATRELSGAMEALRSVIDGFARAPEEAERALREALDGLRAVVPPPSRLGQQYDDLAQHIQKAADRIAASGQGISDDMDRLRRAGESLAGVLGQLEQAALGIQAREVEHASQLKLIEASVLSVNRATSELEAGALDSKEAVSILESEARRVLTGISSAVDQLEQKIRER